MLHVFFAMDNKQKQTTLISQLKAKLIVMQGIDSVEVEELNASKFEDPLRAFTTANDVLDSIQDWQEDHYRLLVIS